MNKFIEKFKNNKQWINWKFVSINGKQTKVPISSFTNTKIDVTKESSSYGTYEDVSKKDKKGYCLPTNKTILFIDIDHCVENNIITHPQKELIFDLIMEADTYTELSPSGTGLHLYFECEPFDLIAHKKEPFEIYNDKRFFTFTGNSYKEEKEVRKINKEQALFLLSIIDYPFGKGETKTIEHTPTNFTDEELLKKIIKSKNGKKFELLYNGDTTFHNNDASFSDCALCSTLAFWTGCNKEQIERIWLNSPLGKREKTQKRKDYRDRTINYVVNNCKEVYKPRNEIIKKEKDIDFLFTETKNGGINFIQNTENICRILRKSGNFKFDDFKNRIEFKGREIQDVDIINIQSEIAINHPYFSKVGKEMVADAVTKVCKENTYDSAKDYITSIKWDGKSRLDTWLTSTYNVLDCEYYKKVGSNWFKGLVKRLIYPGCKFDYLMVLEGDQGIKKSTSLAIIGGDWHVETTMSTDSKDFFMQFEGKAIIEFSEGETLNKTEVKKMKAIITTQVDRYRPAYGRFTQDFPRRCVFAMTTNKNEYLKDDTGNRRWLPVSCVGNVNIEWLKENRDQLFAEAYHRVVNLKETVWEFPKEETEEMQKERMISSPNEGIIVDWYLREDRSNGVTIDQAYLEAMCGGYIRKPLERYQEMDIANIFRNVLNLINRRVMIDGIRHSRWYKMNSPEITMQVEPVKTKLQELKEF